METTWAPLPGIDTSDYQLQLYASAIVVALLASLLIWCIQPDPEAAVQFLIQPPEACSKDWKGEILDKPSIKVLRGPQILGVE
jgi:hypothetical protein